MALSLPFCSRYHNRYHGTDQNLERIQCLGAISMANHRLPTYLQLYDTLPSKLKLLLNVAAFLMITAKLSDVWGIKSLLLICATIFLIFSMACGGAQTMTQLIVFRAFQGIGGSGLYSLTFVSVMKMVVPEKIGFYSGIISSVSVLANLLGPLLGDIIADWTTWRWCFFLK
jgi:MFS family permease